MFILLMSGRWFHYRWHPFYGGWFRQDTRLGPYNKVRVTPASYDGSTHLGVI